MFGKIVGRENLCFPDFNQFRDRSAPPLPVASHVYQNFYFILEQVPEAKKLSKILDPNLF